MADATSTDVSKMKVVDLRKELKSRGLSSAGDKADLVARLQAVLSSDVKDKDSSDEHEQEQLVWDDIDSDGVLDEDEKNHTDLLEDSAVDSINEELVLADQPSPAKQPQQIDSKPGGDKSKHSLKRKITMSESAKDKKSSDKNTTENKETVAKKIVLNRSTSLNSMLPTQTAEKTEGSSPTENIKEDSSIDSVKPKISANIDPKTRLELRAKRFGIPVKMSDNERKEARKQRFGQNAGKTSVLSGDIDTNLDKLKKRAERFGQSVSKFMAVAENKDKLERRKAKFGTVK